MAAWYPSKLSEGERSKREARPRLPLPSESIDGRKDFFGSYHRRMLRRLWEEDICGTCENHIVNCVCEETRERAQEGP